MSDDGSGVDAPANKKSFPYAPAQWKPGQSGNPKGRPKKDRDIIKQAKDAAEDGMKTLVKLMKSSDERVALAAAQAIIDRAIGKPVNTTVNVGKRDLVDLDIAELHEIATGGSSGDHQQDEGEDGVDPVH